MKKILFTVVLFLGGLWQLAAQHGLTGVSEAFTMDTKNPEVTLISPNGGDSLSYLIPLEINWLASDSSFGAAPVSAGLSTDENGTINWLAPDIPNSGSVTIDPPDNFTDFAKAHIKAVDSFGNEALDMSDNYFQLFGLVSAFTAEPDSGIAPLSVSFTDLSTGNPVSWQWDFNSDGTIDSEEQNPVWVYNEPGNYTVTLTVSDGANNDSEMKQDFIVVTAPAYGIINVVASQRTDGSKKTDIEFDLYGNEPAYYVWLEISFNGGGSYQIANQVSGDTGWIAPAQNRQITWNAGDEFPDGFYSKTMRVKVSADFSIAEPPTVTTSAISNITQTTATSGGNVTSDGGASVTARGVVWSTSANPTIEQNQGMTNNGEGTGEFGSNLTSLSPATTYFVKAYATNSEGTSYGDELSFTTLSAAFICGNDFTDARDGKVYGTVQIGTQCWMKQNLNIGSRINGSSNQTNNGTIEKYCYNNSESNCDVYGGLYQWNEMMQYSTTQIIQGICPSGWHLPTSYEWTILINYLGGESIAGGKLKEAGLVHWSAPNTGATNSSGFTGLPSGYRSTDGLFYGLTGNGYFWSSSQYNTINSYGRLLYRSSANAYSFYYEKLYGLPVRCLKDN